VNSSKKWWKGWGLTHVGAQPCKQKKPTGVGPVNSRKTRWKGWGLTHAGAQPCEQKKPTGVSPVNSSKKRWKGWGLTHVGAQPCKQKKPTGVSPVNINRAIITLKQTACRCPTVGTAAPAALGGGAGRRLRRPLGSRHRPPPPQAPRYIQGSSP